MNPAGIPTFYGAFSEEVAVAEVRPPVGSLIAVGKFSLLRAIKLLDVSFLPFAYHEASIFSPAYNQLRSKVAFLEKFHRRISHPVLPSDEALAYLPTQAVSAYVANVMGLDGLIYASIQVGAEGKAVEQVERKFCNIALFGDAAKVLGTEPKPPYEEPPPVFGLGLGNVVAVPVEASARGEANAPKEAADPASAADDARTYATDTLPSATLRAEPQPSVVKVHSVKVDAVAMFAHLCEDGKVAIHGFDDDEDYQGY